MPHVSFRQRLTQGVMLADGAMGTVLHAERHLPIDTCFDLLNTTEPEVVTDVHRRYVESGAEIIETNTFSANIFKLGECDLQDECAAINRAGVDAARRAIELAGRDDVYIAGSVGPLGVRLAPFGRTSAEDAFAAFQIQVGALIDAGADLLLFETFTDLAQIELAVRAAREHDPAIPVIAQMTFSRDDRTTMGDTPAQVARALHATGADVIGLNCSGGPAQLLRLLQMMRRAAPEARCSVMPNAGWPEMAGGRVMYPATPDYFGEYALAFMDAGAAIVGGCCGTKPAHTRAMREALDQPARPRLAIVNVSDRADVEDNVTPELPTHLARKLAEGQFVTTVEMTPPRSFAAEKVVAAAELLREAGADFINVSDSPMARMRMSPWAVCHLVQARTGLETVLHFPTRGRNLLRVQSDLLASHALNVRNVFVVMGDPTVIGDYPDSFDTHDIVPTSLIKLIKRNLNTGIDQAGNSIGQPTTFQVGCALNIGARDLPREMSLLRKKIDAGADFALTQPVFDPGVVERFLRAYEAELGPLSLPVLVGILPLFGARHASFLHNEVPGVDIPAALLHRVSAAGDQSAQEGVKIARELVLDLRDMVQGLYVMPAFGRYDLAADVIDVLGRSATPAAPPHLAQQ